MFSHDRFVIYSLSIITMLYLLSTAVAVAASVLTSATQHARELATRRVLGATRTQIMRELLRDSSVLTVVGAIAGLLVVLLSGHVSVFSIVACALVVTAGLIGAWLAARCAAALPLARSGLFVAAADRREDFNSL